MRNLLDIPKSHFKAEKRAKALYNLEYAEQYRKHDEVFIQDYDYQHYSSRLQEICLAFSYPIEVLDVGCGTGRYFHCLKNTKLLIGIDISEKMLQEAKNPLFKEKILFPVNLLRGNIFSKELDLQAFDFIFSIGVLGEHAPFDEITCKRLLQLLKPLGICYFTIVDLDERKSWKRKIVECFFPYFPPIVKKFFEKRWEINYLTYKQLHNILGKFPNIDFRIERYKSNAKAWKGSHFECWIKKKASLCKKEKKVLMITTDFGKGGAERSFTNVSNELSKHYEVTNVVFNRDYKIIYPLTSNVVSLDVKGGNSIFQKILHFLVRIRRLQKLKQTICPDFSISFLEGADYVNILSRKTEKVVISIRGSKEFDQEINGWLGFLRKKILIPLFYKFADKIVANSHELKWELINLFKLPQEKITTISNLYDIETVTQLAQLPLSTNEAFLFNNYKVILHVGRLHPQKNQLGALKVFSKVVAKEPLAKIIFLGDGNLENNKLGASLKQYCLDAGLKAWNGKNLDVLAMKDLSEKNVFFLDYRNNPFNYYKNAKLFILTSLWEGFPNVLAEALICECPVLASACPTGPKEILCENYSTLFGVGLSDPIETNYGILMPILESSNEQCINTWANKICELLKDETKMSMLTKRGKERMKLFERSKIVQEWLNMLESIS